MKKNKTNFILLTLLVSLVGVSAIALTEYLFGVVAVFTLAIITVFVVGSYIAIENIYRSLKNKK
jgi:hypothetical protein